MLCSPRLIYVLVDDDEDDRFLAKLALEKVHWQLPLLEFTDGQDLLDHLSTLTDEQLQETSRWLIVLDLNMPRLNGFDTLKALRAHPIWSTLPVVVFSTSTDERTRQKALNQGASAYFVKPDTVEQLTLLFNKHFTALVAS